MRLTRLNADLLRLPATEPGGGATALLVALETDIGPVGFGPCLVRPDGARALRATLTDSLLPLLEGEDPLDRERLFQKARTHLDGLGWPGLAARAYAAVDVALWDIAGKTAGLPVWKLLGGASASALAFQGDAAIPEMSPAEVREAMRPAIQQGVGGLLVRLEGSDPEADLTRIEQVRNALGDDVWFALRAAGRYDLRAALSLAHYAEEEIGVDWFEDFAPADDLEGHARLATQLEVPIAAGGRFDDAETFRRFLDGRAAGLLRPDVGRLGGITPWLKVAALAQCYRRSLVPRTVPHVAVQLACGVPGVHSVELSGALTPLFGAVTVARGRAVPPDRPGLGLQLSEGAVAKYRVET